MREILLRATQLQRTPSALLAPFAPFLLPFRTSERSLIRFPTLGRGGGRSKLCVAVPEIATGEQGVAYALFELLEFDETVVGFAVVEDLISASHLETARGRRRSQGDPTQLVFEGGQQFLRGPGGPELPAAAGAVFDFHYGFCAKVFGKVCHGTGGAGGGVVRGI